MFVSGEMVRQGEAAVKMYERMLDKHIVPDENAILEHLGAESHKLLSLMEKQLNANYQLIKELKFPFGNEYGWGYKYNHKTSHLCYAFFEKDAFTVMFQIGDKHVPSVEAAFSSMLPKTRDLWKNRYPCGEYGGWVHYRVLSEDELSDVLRLLFIRKRPIKNKEEPTL